MSGAKSRFDELVAALDSVVPEGTILVKTVEPETLEDWLTRGYSVALFRDLDPKTMRPRCVEIDGDVCTMVWRVPPDTVH